MRLLILLHGDQGDRHDWDGLDDLLVPGPEWRAISLRGPHRSTAGWRWYGDDAEGLRGYETSLSYLDRELTRLVATLPCGWHDVTIGGFSQGAAMALGWGLTTTHEIGGVWAIATSARQLAGRSVEWSAKRNTPVLLCHGLDDDVVPISAGRALRDLLLARGLVRLSFDEHAMGHEVCGWCIERARGWLAGA